MNTGLRATKKARTRALLIETAIRLFARQGIEATTVDQIAQQAGIGKGTVYNYFATKEDLIVAFMADLETRAQTAAGEFAERKAPVHEILAAFAWHHLESKRDYRDFVRAFLARMLAPDEAFQVHVVEMQKAIDATLTTLFSRLQERGLMRRDLDLPALLLNYKTMNLGLTILWVLEGPEWGETRKVLASQMSMFAEGVRP